MSIIFKGKTIRLPDFVPNDGRVHMVHCDRDFLDIILENDLDSIDEKNLFYQYVREHEIKDIKRASSVLNTLNLNDYSRLLAIHYADKSFY